MTRTFVVDRSLCQRILAEYQELPTLRLSVRQAARLWSVAPDHCQQTLDLLVAEGWLSRSVEHHYCVSQDLAGTAWSLDQRCRVTVQLSGPQRMLVIEATDADAAIAIDRVADRTARRVARAIDTTTDWRSGGRTSAGPKDG